MVRSLRGSLKTPAILHDFVFYRADLRWDFPKPQMMRLRGQQIQKIERRAKYILIWFSDSIMVSHLGMTGQWTYYSDFNPLVYKPKKHDHLIMTFQSKEALVYSDPRRFGFIDMLSLREMKTYFGSIGVEPLSDLDEGLIDLFKKSDRPIKIALMDQRLLVGVGNIYACEALFKSGLSPLKKCGLISAQNYGLLFKNIKSILEVAIESGGSSISDYVDAHGVKGSFQNQFKVYGRSGEPCFVCASKIKKTIQAGRSTFYCPTCQKS